MNMKWNNLIRAVGVLFVSSITSQALALSPMVTPIYMAASLFAAPNYPVGFPAPNDPTLQANLVSKAAYGVVFGISVDKKVYDDLQTKQGLTGSVPGPIVAGLPTSINCASATEKYKMGPCAPSLSKAEITSMFTGEVRNWNTGFGLTTVAGGAGDMAICRRVVGSGTQAAANAYWTENPCRGADALNFISAIDGAAYKVIENSASGDVINCHNQMFAGTCATCGGLDFGSIGFNAIEKQPTASDNWAYVKVSDVEPTVANYLDGTYDYAYENTVQIHKSLSTATSEYLTLNMVATQAISPLFLNSAAVTGVAALCGLGFSPSAGTPGAAGVGLAPVTRMTRGGNSCAVATLCAARGTL